MSASRKHHRALCHFNGAAMSIACLAIVIAGCAGTQSDAPAGLQKVANWVGVSIRSIKPYTITSYTTLHPGQSHRQMANSGESHNLVSIAQRCYKTWCLNVRAYPRVATAWEAWRQHDGHECLGAHKLVCGDSPWGKALSQLYIASTQLLGHAPLPLHVRIIVLPEGTGYHGAVTLHSATHVPLKFAFPFPTDRKEPGFAEQADHALIHAVATVGYEFQHVEYAAGQTSGPVAPPGAKAAKDEANSECWKLVTEAFLTKHSTAEVSFFRETGLMMQMHRAITGGKSGFSDAAVIGPALLRRHLGKYLIQRYPGIRDSLMIRISPNDVGATERMLSYCRAFVRYSGNILQTPMPTKIVKPVPLASRL